jgi:dTDP-4-amino-2,4-dideoxy-beta-L-xylose N-methyltransferase
MLPSSSEGPTWLSRDFEQTFERSRTAPAARSLLDVACGTGWHLERLRAWYSVEGLDASSAMLQRARERLPDISLHEADMRAFDLGTRFDAVICLSSSIAHMQTLADLDRAVACMARHVQDAGVLVIEPWDFPEDPRVTDHGSWRLRRMIAPSHLSR